MNKYLIGILVVLLIAISSISKMWINERNNAVRWEENSSQLENYYNGELSQIKLKSSEFKDHMADSTKKLLDSLKIAPKKVIEYVTIHHYSIDTVYVNVPTVRVNDSTYVFSDTTKCFVTSGEIITSDPDHQLIINNREYRNTEQYFLYKNKESFKFIGLSIKKFWKKSFNDLEIINECGDSQVKRIEVSKK